MTLSDLSDLLLGAAIGAFAWFVVRPAAAWISARLPRWLDVSLGLLIWALMIWAFVR